MTDAWDPEVYRRFATERVQPFHDLVALVEPARIARAVDLGCGSGELTATVSARLSVDDLVGIDSSAAMLGDTRRLTRPGLRFERGDISSWTAAGDHDLVLANASLQWVADHAEVLARWTSALGPGGQLAVQVPANADHPSHRAAVDVALREPFHSALQGDPPADPVAANVLTPERYAEVLHDLGFEHQHVRLQVYGHVLADTASVVAWTSGTTLTRFAARLDPATYDEFVEAYRVEVLRRLGDRSPYFYPFKRILLWGRRPQQ